MSPILPEPLLGHPVDPGPDVERGEG